MNGLKSWAALADILFPRRCPVCDRIVQPAGALICPGCYGKVSFVKEPSCKKCGKEIEDNRAEYCSDCVRRIHSFHSGLALLNYNSTARKIIADFKYRNKRENADFLAAALWSRYGQELLAMEADLLIPVPLHRRRERIRGFNQAWEIAVRLGVLMEIPVCKRGLKREKYTKPQKELSHEGRLKNLMKAFTADCLPEGVRTVILVDDIYTTGSTAEACSRVLLEAGVQKVYVVSGCIGRNS